MNGLRNENKKIYIRFQDFIQMYEVFFLMKLNYGVIRIPTDFKKITVQNQ